MQDKYRKRGEKTVMPNKKGRYSRPFIMPVYMLFLLVIKHLVHVFVKSLYVFKHFILDLGIP